MTATSPKVIIRLVCLGLALAGGGGGGLAWAQPATTQLTVPMYTAAGGRFTGTIVVSWPSFTSADGYAISAGSRTLNVTNGTLTGTLVPTDALSGDSANTRYRARYSTTAGQPLSPPLTEIWDVPTASPVTSLDELRSIAPPPYTPTSAPSNGPYITKTVSGALSGEFSLGTLADNAIVACDVATAICTPRAAIGTDLEAMSGWPSGLTMTELGYVNGVTSAIQTQLDAKLPLSGGTIAGTLQIYDPTAVTGVSQEIIRAGAGQSTNALLVLRNNANATLSSIGPQGDWATYDPSNGKLKSDFAYTGQALASDLQIAWNATDDLNTFSVDVTLGRSSAGVLYVNDGAGNLRDLGTRRIGVGGVPNSSWAADVQASGSTGTFRVWDQTPTTGFTAMALKAGEGQGITNLMLFEDFAGTLMGGIGPTGDVFTVQSSKRKVALYQNGAFLTSDSNILFKDVVGLDDAGSFDTGMSRNAPGIVEANSGTPGTLRDVLARLHIGAATSSADSQLQNSQFTFVLTSNTNLQIRAKGSDGTVRTADITLAP